MPQAQLVTDPGLTQTAVEATDLLVGWRPVLNAQGGVTGYQPYNITAANFSSSIVAMGLLLLGSTLPDSAPSGGGLFLNDDAFSYSPVEGTTSGTPLSPEALATSLKALLLASPAMGSSTNFHGIQANAGVNTVVDDGT